jgi:serine/threonine protein kinase
MHEAARAPSPEDAPQTKRYDVLASIAKGGMGEVLVARALDDARGRIVVLKAPLPHISEEDEYREAFLDEARLTARLSHPNIARVYEVLDLDSRPCMVMEYLTGHDFRKVLSRSVEAGVLVPVDVASAIVRSVASALAYAHSARDDHGQPLGVVHRDVSPHNVFLTRGGEVKLIDFGIARSALRSSKTATGVLKGKLGYMSPEAIKGQRVDARTDIWSLGVVAWELLATRRLFLARDDRDPIGLVLSADIPPPSSFRADVDAELDAIVLSMLVRQPEQRVADAAVVVEAIDGWARTHRLADRKRLADWLESLIPKSEDIDYAKRSSTKTIQLPQLIDVEPTATRAPALRDDRAASTASLPVPSPATRHGDAGAATKILAPDQETRILPPNQETRILPREAPAKRRSGLAIAAGALVLVALVATAAVAMLRGSTTPTAAPANADKPLAERALLRVAGVPEGARVEIDGEPRAAGEALVPRGPQMHHVAVLSSGGEVLFAQDVAGENATLYYVEAPPASQEAPIADEVEAPTMRPPRRRPRDEGPIGSMFLLGP